MGVLDKAPAAGVSAPPCPRSEEQQGRPSSFSLKQGRSAPAAGPAITIPSFRMTKRQQSEASGAGECWGFLEGVMVSSGLTAIRSMVAAIRTLSTQLVDEVGLRCC